MAGKLHQEVLQIDGMDITVQTRDSSDYISLTDLARRKTDEPSSAIANWMRLKDTILFLGVWETVHNPKFKPIEFEGFKNQAGTNAFTMTPSKWIVATGATGVRVSRGKYGGTFAHVDIAMDFATWISPEFRLHVFEEYRRLKADETSRLNLEWQQNRLFSALNYRLHTDAVKESISPHATSKDAGLVYATEADLLNLAVFGQTARQWRSANPEASGNMRDYASASQLLVLNNLEAINAMLIRQGLDREERFKQLQAVARQQEASFKAMNIDRNQAELEQ